MKFADLHCHPHLRSFNRFRGTRIEKRNKNFTPWHIVLSKLTAKQKGKRANAYSQCDLIKLVNGNLRLAFVSLYPIEKGWVMGRPDLPKKVFMQAVKSLTNNILIRMAAWVYSSSLRKLILKLGESKGNRIAFRDFLQMFMMRIPLKRVEFLQGDTYDYFEELNREKDFLLSRNGQTTEAEIFIPFLKNIFVSKRRLKKKYPDEFKATGTYLFAQNGQHLNQIVEQTNSIAFVATIEGANVFNTSDTIDVIIEKIKRIKGRGPVDDNWKECPVFFIGFDHHFNNHLSGHAHSLPDYANLVIDQSTNMNQGFTNKGWKVIRYFLSLNEENDYDPDEFGRRILIDLKHMSARSRKEYYSNIIHPCSEKGDGIPIIASHIAYSGVKTLDELIANAPNETDKDAPATPEKPFNTWNINMCNEDILEIFKTRGLIGVTFDERVLGIPKQNPEQAYPDNYSVSYYWKQIKGMMDVILESDLPEKKKCTETFMIGTDFDGFIDPMDKYPTVLEFKQLRSDLIDEINRDPEGIKYLFDLSTEKFVDRFCFENGYEFAVKNFK